MRTIISKQIENPSSFKKQLLQWANQFREVVFLDSNNYHQQYSNFDCVLAVDAFTSIKTDSEKDVEDLHQVVNESAGKPVLIFKHSTRCSISRMVLKQFENEFDLQDKITPYFLDLLNHRDVSNEIATKFDVYHQSPQLIVIQDGKSVYDASHDSIDAQSLQKFV